MNKGELIDSVASQTNLSKADAGRAVDAMIDAIEGTLKVGNTVSLVGFGTFSVKSRAARQGRNPRTGEPVHVEEKHVPFFKTGKELRDRLNERKRAEEAAGAAGENPAAD